MKSGFKLLEVKSLLAHELVDPAHLVKLMSRIANDGYVKNPVIVDQKTKVILDGHHRTECLRLMHCHLVPAMIVDYLSDQVRVFPRRKNFRVSKTAVLEQGLAKRPFPHKTTRNWIKGRIRNINISLNRLK